ncbi:MAG: fructosamine kinase family protein [Rikenellaceae bacterium]|nr:fructosamine kinase family protein [Rikenellaceae bacterium]
MFSEFKNTIGKAVNEELESFHGTGPVTAKSGKKYFVKCGNKSGKYLCEAHGLMEIHKSGYILTPEVIAVGEKYIVTSYIESVETTDDFFTKLGHDLAMMHKNARSDSYGFYEDNFIGDNDQQNTPSNSERTSWCEFYFNKRLLYQYRLAEVNDYVTDELTKLFINIENRITGIIGCAPEHPSLLHGDLWSGNYICSLSGNPYIIDPAVYYGHREAELAMTKMFGGFSNSFYRSYDETYPLAEGWEYREDIYKLYHVLNHLNLFGKSYYPQALSILRKYNR